MYLFLCSSSITHGGARPLVGRPRNGTISHSVPSTSRNDSMMAASGKLFARQPRGTALARPPPRARRRGDRMKRREFISLLGGAAVAWPLAARAQQPDQMRRIGVLISTAADDAEGRARIAAFLGGLGKLGWIDGHNVRIDTRWPTSTEEVRKYAAELIALAPDVILATGSPSLSPLLEATRAVPIVFVNVGDP